MRLIFMTTPGHFVSGISKLLLATKENRFHQGRGISCSSVSQYTSHHAQIRQNIFLEGVGAFREVLNIFFFCGLGCPFISQIYISPGNVTTRKMNKSCTM
jgi:hypothetical protein